MINIYRAAGDDCDINVFSGRNTVSINEIRIEHDANYVAGNTVIYPAKPGNYAFGGAFVYTNNGMFPELNKRPLPLHDRDMDKE